MVEADPATIFSPLYRSAIVDKLYVEGTDTTIFRLKFGLKLGTLKRMYEQAHKAGYKAQCRLDEIKVWKD